MKKTVNSKETNFKEQANFSLPIAYNKILRMFVITLRIKFKKTEIRKIIFRSKWRCIKGAKSPIKITPDRGTKITKVVDD
jgi:hypothetical protein